MDKIIQALEQRLKSKVMTKKALAKELNVLPSNLSKRWNSGSMKIRELSEICKILDLDIQIEEVKK